MYLNKIITHNLGPISKINLDLPFNSNGNPKPLIIVGENGTGKSIFISNIVDSFYEIIGSEFLCVRKNSVGTAYKYFKIIDLKEIKYDEKYLFSYIEFKDKMGCIDYLFKSGDILKTNIEKLINKNLSNSFSWEDNANFKNFDKHNIDVKKLLEKDILCYFGPNRYERPFWLNQEYYEDQNYDHLELEYVFSNDFSNNIMIAEMTKKNLRWLLDVIADSRPDIEKNIVNQTWNIAHIDFNNLQILQISRENAEKIMSSILGEDVYFGLNLRAYKGNRFNVMSRRTNKMLLCSLDALSTGQSALFNMFVTIIRYSDNLNLNNSIRLEDITGTIVIDEIDLHLHSNMQFDILPKLIKLFPKVQFIITTHAPLFLLGMEKTFGNDGFEIIEMPKGNVITAERFSEFGKAYDFLKETNKFENDIKKLLNDDSVIRSPLIITEGKTDSIHLQTAKSKLENLEGNEFLKELNLEFFKFEQLDSSVIKQIEMGSKQLSTMCKEISKIRQNKKIIFIADSDVPEINNIVGSNSEELKYKDWGNNVYSFILPIPDSRKDIGAICIEHLFTDAEIKTTDSNGRRLFLGNEFDERGIGIFNNSIMCERKTLCGENSISIIDGSTNEKVTYLSDKHKNIALSKNSFAVNIANDILPFNNFDFSNFLSIFKIIDEIWKLPYK